MDYPLRFVDQLRPHLKALRKRRGLTQAQAGALIGVSQARVAEIEAGPGAVSFEQLMKLLSALGASFVLREDEPPAFVPDAADEQARAPDALPDDDVKLPQAQGKWTVRRMSDQSVLASVLPEDSADLAESVAARRLGMGALLRELRALNPDKTVEPTSRRNFLIRAKRETW
ncbi:helix-turn-helix domain-containing protein [Variovorax sp. W6]|uniref:helix-turn-helix domain-containing protein n=1 Tax=Variovorax sp. W6 TaxID=3093895 RepID=UPI003D806D47